ncbi:ribonuclease III domain-containing protein [Chytriomyces sp. MP71]|nr:ribonuclease III domain-containing protein [Chytriomyces sp. MP71]
MMQFANAADAARRRLGSCRQLRLGFGVRGNSSSSSLSAETVASLSAFRARLGVALPSSNEALLVALTHRSFVASSPNNASNSNSTTSDSDAEESQRNRILGARLLLFHVTNHVLLAHPRLPAHAVESLVEAYVGDRALADMGRISGIHHVMRWKKNKTLEEGLASVPGQAIAVARVVQALVGAIYHDQGARGVDEFIKRHVLSRVVDVASHLRLQVNPKGTLRAILKEQKRPSPVSRMLKETGRLSVNPVFIVGVYSGLEKIGEGYGSSIAMAETRACKNALERHFTKEVKDVQVPLDMLTEENLTFAEDSQQQQ